MTKFIFEIQATTPGNVKNIGEAKSLESAVRLAAKSVGAGTLITIEKLKVITNHRGAAVDYDHIETFEYEVA